MSGRQMKQVAAMMMIGDGVVAMIAPRQDAMVWARGPRFWRRTMVWLAEHPTATRLIGAAEAAGGVLLAVCQKEE